MVAESCCFIGHRQIQVSNELIARLNYTVEKLIENGVRRFIFGSRSDFNDLCHEVVTKFKERYPDIIRVGYTTRSEMVFFEEEKEKAIRIFSDKIKTIHFCEESYYPEKLYFSGKGSYAERNCIMIDDSDYCVFYYDKTYKPEKKQISRKSVGGIYTSGNSGTAFAYKYAEKKKKQILNVFGDTFDYCT